jgi:hypothetical protein
MEARRGGVGWGWDPTLTWNIDFIRVLFLLNPILILYTWSKVERKSN